MVETGEKMYIFKPVSASGCLRYGTVFTHELLTYQKSND